MYGRVQRPHQVHPEAWPNHIYLRLQRCHSYGCGYLFCTHYENILLAIIFFTRYKNYLVAFLKVWYSQFNTELDQSIRWERSCQMHLNRFFEPFLYIQIFRQPSLHSCWTYFFWPTCIHILYRALKPKNDVRIVYRTLRSTQCEWHLKIGFYHLPRQTKPQLWTSTEQMLDIDVIL